MIKLYSKTESSYKRYYYHLSRNIIICARDMLCSKNFKKFEIFLSLYLTLADEPTGNLDEDTAAEITEILKKNAHELNRCVVVVTHSEAVAKEADIVFHLQHGRLE